MRMGDAGFVDRFAEAGRPGTYLAIDTAGELGAFDAIELVDRPGHGLTVGDVERAYHTDRELLPALVDCPDLSDAWRDWARRALARSRAGVARKHRRRVAIAGCARCSCLFRAGSEVATPWRRLNATFRPDVLLRAGCSCGEEIR